MHLLLLDTEGVYYAGAEVVLGYYLKGLKQRGIRVTVAVVEGSPLADHLDGTCELLALSSNQRFNVSRLWKQADVICNYCKTEGVTHVHGWIARSWELASVLGMRTGLPVYATLHDHPRSRFISKARQTLMQTCAKGSFKALCCVSDAVRTACMDADYPEAKLVVAHNGLPHLAEKLPPKPNLREVRPLRLGYLGAFSKRKGTDGLLEFAEHLARATSNPWDLIIAGDAQDDAARVWIENLQTEYSDRPWWGLLDWRGWVDDPAEFLHGTDLLLVCSAEFDPLPTVILEAAAQGTAVLAPRIGGVPEMIIEDETGWLYQAEDWEGAAKLCAELMEVPEHLHNAGEAAHAHIAEHFTVESMVKRYLEIYEQFG